MNPWDIIGWTLVVVAGVPTLLVMLFGLYLVLVLAWGFILARVRHWKTRRTPPAPGQVWRGLGRYYTWRVASVDGEEIRVEWGGWTPSGSTAGSRRFSRPEWARFVQHERVWLVPS